MQKKKNEDLRKENIFALGNHFVEVSISGWWEFRGEENAKKS